jgi:hypothetical protein
VGVSPRITKANTMPAAGEKAPASEIFAGRALRMLLNQHSCAMAANIAP